MITFADGTISWVIQLMLMITRVSSMFVLSPVLGRNSIPARLKIGFSLLLALMLINLFPPVAPLAFQTLPALLFAVAAELIIGFVIGFVTILFFNIVFTAGHLIDMQLGFAMATMYDPATNSNMPISGSLLNIIMIQSFLVTGGLPRLVGVVANTFKVIPVGGAVFPATPLLGAVLDAFMVSFTLSVNVAMPVMASALLAEIGLGIIVRTAPQMNVFVIGIPIKVLLGLIMIFLMVPIFVYFTNPIFDVMYDTIDSVIKGMTPA